MKKSNQHTKGLGFRVSGFRGEDTYDFLFKKYLRCNFSEVPSNTRPIGLYKQNMHSLRESLPRSRNLSRELGSSDKSSWGPGVTVQRWVMLVWGCGPAPRARSQMPPVEFTMLPIYPGLGGTLPVKTKKNDMPGFTSCTICQPGTTGSRLHGTGGFQSKESDHADVRAGEMIG